MNKTLVNRALSCLAHPLSILAILTLAANALVLQPQFPSWWTGKIGDMAWMVFSPFLLILFLALFIPSTREVNLRRIGIASLAMVGAAFSLLKAVPPVNAAISSLGTSLHFPMKLLLDPTDLLALPCLLLAGWVWQRQQQRQHNPALALRLLAVVGAALAITADAAAPRNLGITCVIEQEDSLVAFNEKVFPAGYFKDPQNGWSDVYVSTDGGLTWAADADYNTEEFTCPNTAVFPVDVPGESGLQLFFMEEQGIYSSLDGGDTLSLEQKVKAINSLVVAESAQSIVFAAGNEGVMVRAADGTWTSALASEIY